MPNYIYIYIYSYTHFETGWNHSYHFLFCHFVFSLRPYISDFGNKDGNSFHPGFRKGWTVASKEIPPVVFTTEPTNHETGDPFLVGTLGSQYGTGTPSRQTGIEDFGNCRALESAPQQNTNEPNESVYCLFCFV